MVRPLAWPGSVIAATVVLADMYATQVHSPIRAALAALWIALCPGLSLAWLLGAREAVPRLAVGSALSIGLTIAIATAMVYTRWSPWAGLGLLAMIALTCSLIELVAVARAAAA
jgi:uncharacterized membrane protein